MEVWMGGGQSGDPRGSGWTGAFFNKFFIISFP